jgi:phage tail sheath gpL-like
MPRGGIHQQTVQTRARPGVPGMPVHGSLLNKLTMLVNKDPQADEVWTVDIDTATDTESYSILLAEPSRTIAIVAASSTDTLVAEQLKVAWNSDPIAGGVATATRLGSVVTLTGSYPGIAFAITEGDNAAKMTTTNTQNAAVADTVPFGRAMVSTEFQTDYPDELGVIAKSTALSARVSTLTVTYAVGEIYTVGITVGGARYEVNVAADTNDDTTAAAINTALNLMLPAATVISSVATNVVTLTAELAGQYFEVDLGLVSGTTARLALADTTNTPACDINKSIAGISLFTYDEEGVALPSAASDDASYKANAGVNIMKQGQVWVEVDSGTTITAGDDVYIELDGTGSAAGRLYTANSATRTLLDPSLVSWKRAAFSGSDADIAVVSVNLPH